MFDVIKQTDKRAKRNHSWRVKMAVITLLVIFLIGWLIHLDVLATSIITLGVSLIETFFWLENTNNELDRLGESHNADLRLLDQRTKDLEETIKQLKDKHGNLSH
jgi:cell division protein FtsB